MSQLSRLPSKLVQLKRVTEGDFCDFLKKNAVLTPLESNFADF